LSNSLDTESKAMIQISGQINHKYTARIIALGIKMPGIADYSSYNLLANNAPVLTSSNQVKYNDIRLIIKNYY